MAKTLTTERPAEELPTLTIPAGIHGYISLESVKRFPEGDIALVFSVYKSRYSRIRVRLPHTQADELWKELGSILGR
jgi:hypothetical protein